MQKKVQKKVPQQVRIIAGLWKRTPLAVVDAPGLRPTPDRVRVTLFNWLDFLFQRDWQDKRCLDLFAGSGALGFEAASRGAAQVTLVEAHLPAVQQLQKTRAKLNTQKVSILHGDAQLVADQLTKQAEQFDVIFLDPPFHGDVLGRIFPASTVLLRPNGYLYLEAERALTLDDLPNALEKWKIMRCDRAGMVFFHLLQRL